MTPKEALEWVTGKCSSVNYVPEEPRESWEARIAMVDAMRTQQAYWVLKAEQDFELPHSPTVHNKGE